MLYFMHNEGNVCAIISEIVKMLEVTRDTEKRDDKIFLYANKEILMMTARVQNPKIPGQDTSLYENWHWRYANKRKAIHSECAEENVKHSQKLIELAYARV